MKNIYSFSEGSKELKPILGGKGANLAEMTSLHLPIPPGFTITTEVCKYFLKESEYPEDFSEDMDKYLSELEEASGKKFGSIDDPLLVSVRSGAAISMPGMMDTVLNLGLNDDTLQGLISKTQNPRFAYDSYRRFVAMFGNVVLGLSGELFEDQFKAIKSARGVKLDTELSEADLREAVSLFKAVVFRETGQNFPENPEDQLKLAIEAVFKSWDNPRAITYRKIHGIHDLIGTAVTVQSMVFGNMGPTSGTGVMFTRNPSTGEKKLYGEYLMNAQGEDVVAGTRTPHSIQHLKEVHPHLYEQLVDIKDSLEIHYKDMQDIEFTIEEGKLYFLQTRTGKRTARAAVKIATDLVDEGVLSEKEALMSIEAKALDQLLHPMMDPKAEKEVIAHGLPASPGAASGAIVFEADEAVETEERGEKVILVRRETSPEDIHGIHAANGILTSTGGMTSHAAVVARGMGKCCVAGCGDIIIDKKHRKVITQDGIELKEGTIITLDGTSGEVIIGEIPTVESEITPEFQRILDWADKYRTLQVRANADTPEDTQVAKDFGAEGIGLCRTEHMFFEEDRIMIMREMILSHNPEAKNKALAKLLPIQKRDFIDIFTVMGSSSVTIRLLDPPLHEFLPYFDKKIEELARILGVTFEELKNTIEALHEVNPMLGHRGCRLGITNPEVYRMQVQAIVEAAIECYGKGIKVQPEIEIPLVGNFTELKYLRAEVEDVIERYKDAIKFPIKIGTMIEIPRACLTSEEIAEYADFFSFGTNDLTQTTYGFSRDDAGKFLGAYINEGIITIDPASEIDEKGVGRLMRFAVQGGRETKPNLEVGICGEHGGEPNSIDFCHRIGLTYVSCSPYRVPIARVAAAQAAIRNEILMD